MYIPHHIHAAADLTVSVLRFFVFHWPVTAINSGWVGTVTGWHPESASHEGSTAVLGPMRPNYGFFGDALISLRISYL